MKRSVFLFGFFMLSFFVSAAYDFCDDGEQGSGLEIVSFEDGMEDNDDEWEWGLGADVEVEVEVFNDDLGDEDFTAELVFVDEDDDEIYVAVDDGDLEEDFSLDDGETDTIKFSFEIEDDADEGVYDVYVKFYLDGDEDEECVEDRQEVRIGYAFCENGNVDDSDLEIEAVRDNNLESDANWEWGLGSEVEIEVEIENKDYDDQEFDVELVFFDEDHDEVSFASSSGDLKESVDIDEDDSEEVTFEFEIDEDIEDGEYYFYVVVVSDEDDDICTSLRVSYDVEVVEDSGVIVKSVSGASEVDAGGKINYSVVVSNLGVSDEERVLVSAYNYAWGISEKVIVYDLGAGDSETISVEVSFPEEFDVDSASILFSADYDYDEDKDHYYESSDSGYDKKQFVSINEVEEVEDVEEVEVEDESLDEAEVVSGDDSSSLGDEGGSNFWVYVSVVVLVLIAVVIFMIVSSKRSGHRRVRHVREQSGHGVRI